MTQNTETRYTTRLTITRGYVVTLDTPEELPKAEAEKLYRAFVDYASVIEEGEIWEVFLADLQGDLEQDGYVFVDNIDSDDDRLTLEYAELYAKCKIHLEIVHAEDDVNELEIEA